jgi:hypothetical protein
MGVTWSIIVYLYFEYISLYTVDIYFSPKEIWVLHGLSYFILTDHWLGTIFTGTLIKSGGLDLLT